METLIVMLAFVLAAIIAIVILSLRKGKGKIREPIIKEIAEREEELHIYPWTKSRGSDLATNKSSWKQEFNTSKTY